MTEKLPSKETMKMTQDAFVYGFKRGYKKCIEDSSEINFRPTAKILSDDELKELFIENPTY